IKSIPLSTLLISILNNVVQVRYPCRPRYCTLAHFRWNRRSCSSRTHHYLLQRCRRYQKCKRQTVLSTPFSSSTL
ncbi:hypothetical protein GGU10DRAFT_406722, partial [Lentinula aff. detonsa]